VVSGDLDHPVYSLVCSSITGIPNRGLRLFGIGIVLGELGILYALPNGWQTHM
jgi:hypothetical protein